MVMLDAVIFIMGLFLLSHAYLMNFDGHILRKEYCMKRTFSVRNFIAAYMIIHSLNDW